MKDIQLEQETQNSMQEAQPDAVADKNKTQEVSQKEKTPEELALEAGYYASCFRSH